MRLFVAIALEAELADRMVVVCRGLMEQAPEAHWSRPESWHLTLQFLGEQPEAELPALTTQLAKVRSAGFRFGWRGLGAFPPHGRMRTLWAGLADPAPVIGLAAAVGRELAPRWPPEDRPFQPHLTLARAGAKGNELEPLRPALSPLKPDWGAQEAREFTLFWSRPWQRRFQYEVLRQFPLQT